MDNRAEKTRQAIFGSVRDLILEGGISAVTLATVCHKAGVSKGGLMHHFETKEAMLKAFIDRSCEQCLTQIREGLSGIAAGDGRRTLAFIDLMLVDPPMCNAEDGCELSAVMIAMMQEKSITDATQFYEDISRELRGDATPRLTIDLIVTSIDGLWLQSMVLPNQTIQLRAKQLRRQLRRLVSESVKQKNEFK